MQHILTNIPEKKHQEAVRLLEQCSDTEKTILEGTDFRSPSNWFILYWFFPLVWLFDRIILGSVWIGLLKLFAPLVFLIMLFTKSASPVTIGIILMVGYFIWVIVDGLNLKMRIKNHNYRRLLKRYKRLRTLR